MPEINEFTTRDEMEVLRRAWGDLVSRSRNASVFQTWEWIWCCRKHFGRGKRLSILTVSEGGRLIGIAPLESARIMGSPLKRLRFIGGEVSDYMDIIADAGHEESVVHSLTEWLEGHARGWDALDLQQIPEGSALLINPIQRSQVLPQEPCPHLPLPASWDEFLASLGKKTRFNIGYHDRTARKDFDMQIGTLAASELDEGGCRERSSPTG